MSSAKVNVVSSPSGDGDTGTSMEPVKPNENLLQACRKSETNSVVPDKIKKMMAFGRSEQSKTQVVRVLYIVVFLDFLGNFLMLSNSLYLFYPVSDATSQSDKDRGVGIFYQDAQDLGLEQTTAQQLGASIATGAQAVAAFLSGYLSKAIGRKGALSCYTFGAAIFYVLTYFSKDIGLIAYYALRICTGLLAGSQPVVNQYIFDLYPDPMEGQKKTAGIAGLIALAVAIGPQIGYVVGIANLFLPFLLAAAASFIGGVLVMILVPNMSSSTPQGSQEQVLETANTISTENNANSLSKVEYSKRNFKYYVAIFWVGRLLDRLGANQMSHVMRMGTRSFDGALYDHFALVFLGFSMLIFGVIPFSLKVSKRVGNAVMPVITQTLCAILTIGMALVFINTDSLVLYLLFFFTQAFFSICAMIAVTPTLVALVPASKKDMWLGYQASVMSTLMALCPLVVAPIVDAEECPNCAPPVDGTIAEGTFLIVAAACTLASIFPYLLLIPKLPIPRQQVGPSPEEEEEDLAITAYEKDQDPEHLRWVSLSKRKVVNDIRMARGDPPIQMRWRSFKEDSEDKGGIDRLMNIGRDDMHFLINLFDEEVYKFENNDEAYRQKRIAEVKQNLGTMEKGWSMEDKHKLGEWMADYLAAGGYLPPGYNARLWKSMIAVNFPPIVKLKKDESPEDAFTRSPTDVWKRFTKIMHNTLAVDTSMQKMNEAATRFNIMSFKPSQLM